jgi:molybdate transport system substrate-binding protein
MSSFRRATAVAGMLGALSVFGPAPAHAAEITVLSGQGDVSGLRELAPAFEKLTGHKVIVSLEAGNAMIQKIGSGAPADIVTAGPDAIDALVKQGKVLAGTRTNFAQAGVGVAVKSGAPRPDISTPEAFKRAMLGATSIAYSRGRSGEITAMAIERLGIAEQLKTKTRLSEGVPVAEIVAKGEAEIGMHQINVILPITGADYIGPLPKELQQYVPFAAGLLAVSKEPEAAKAFLHFIASPEAAPLLRNSGMEPLH